MELRTVSEESSVLEVEVAGSDDTILNLVKEQLLEYDDVEVATYVRGHPRLDTPVLKVETSSGDPKDKLEDAVKDLHDDFDTFESDFLDKT